MSGSLALPSPTAAFTGRFERWEAVRAVRRLAFDTKGNGVLHSAGGDIVLPPNGVLWLSQVKCSVSIEE